MLTINSALSMSNLNVIIIYHFWRYALGDHVNFVKRARMILYSMINIKFIVSDPSVNSGRAVGIGGEILSLDFQKTLNLILYLSLRVLTQNIGT